MKLNINHIAELAQVSKGTVSKVLNGHKGIGMATRERVLALVKQLDYHPDSSARALALQKTGVLGFLVPHEAEGSLSGHYWASVLSGISQQAARHGYSLQVLTTPREGDLQGAFELILRRSTVDGLIIGSELLDKASLVTLLKQQIPFVLLGQNPEFQHFCVDVDNLQGTKALMSHVLAQGYRHIGALLGPENYPYVKERRRGYDESLEGAGVPWSAVLHCPYGSPEIEQRLGAFLDAHPSMDALFVGSGGDFLVATLKVLQAKGLEVPQFGLAAFDDSSFLEVIAPPVTAIRQPLFLVGEAAVDMLLGLLANLPPVSPLLRLPTQLVVRQSCAETPAIKERKPVA